MIHKMFNHRFFFYVYGHENMISLYYDLSLDIRAGLINIYYIIFRIEKKNRTAVVTNILSTCT